MCAEGNQIVVPTPPGLLHYNDGEMTPRVNVCIDACMVALIRQLWACGIVTLGCCCGHGGNVPAHIAVRPDFAPVMRAFGYAPIDGRDDLFILPSGERI